jgi:hypothetical protein
MPVYRCKCCSYETTLKSNFNRHLKTKKHNKNYSEQLQEESNRYICNFCNKGFRFKQSMYRHRKHTCKEKKEMVKKLEDVHNNINPNQH